MASQHKQEALSALRCIERKRRLEIQLAEADRALKANGRRIYDRHGLFGGIDERRLETLALHDLHRGKAGLGDTL